MHSFFKSGGASSAYPLLQTPLAVLFSTRTGGPPVTSPGPDLILASGGTSNLRL